MTITRCDDSKPTDFGPLKELVKDLAKAQLQLGKELVRLAGDSADVLLSRVGPLKMPKLGSCCAVPEPCWMPLEIGSAKLQLAAEGAGEIHFVVTNGDYRSRTFTAKAAGADAGLVQISPASAVLGPNERGAFTAKITNPGKPGTYEALIWILGCRDHYLRVTIVVGEKQKNTCYKVTVDDEPDYVVHWYDHFYCKKPCHGSTAGRNQ
ncbi:MAG: hypothetical protein ISP90_19115 [Nevskia sp.]|nr:hypothetical protein [Nevskia sp.]